jgi:hypothetical protein
VSPAAPPPVSLPLRYLLTAVAALVLATLAVPALRAELAGHYYHPRVLALAHAVGLGWITLSIVGASCQLVPVLLGRALWSERLARWAYPLLGLGALGMVGHFWLGAWAGLAWAAALTGLGLVLHVVNVGATLRGLDRWTATAGFVAHGLAGVALTAGLGLALAAGRLGGGLPGDALANVAAHFHLALLGWVAPMVVGVAARVYPMFLLAAEPGPWTVRVQQGGLLAATPLVVAGLLAGSPLVGPGAALAAASLATHAGWVLVTARRARRPALDWGLRLVVTAAGFLAVAVLVGLGLALGRLAGPRAALAYGVLALGGWVSLTVAGMMLKIVPFLVWQRVYGPRVGREPVPALAALGAPRAEAMAYAGLVAGSGALAAGVAAGSPRAIGAAGAGLALGALALAAALARSLRHLRTGAAGRLAPAAAGERP